MDEDQINAVEMVRAIRDQIYEETKHMSRAEFAAYIRRRAAWADLDEPDEAPQSVHQAE